MKTPFLGGTYTSRSRNLAYDQAINIYPELIETGQGKDIGAFYGCPGLDLFADIGTDYIRGMISTEEFIYFVDGSQMYKVDQFGTVTVLGSLNATAAAVQRMASVKNTVQVAFSDATYLYVWNFQTNSFSVSPTFPVGGTTLTYQEGFALTNVAGTQTFYQSDYNDLTAWSPLAYSSAIQQPENVIALADLHNEVWVISEENSSVWVNSGSANFVFQQLPGVNPEVGGIAPFSVVKVGESLMWLGRSKEGSGIVFKTNGYTPQRVSTHALEREWQDYGDMSDAFAYAYQQEGHLFYVLSFPIGDATYVFDLTASEFARKPMWHRRASFSEGDFHRHWGNAYCFFNGLHLVGDYRIGRIYSFNLNTYTDNGTPRKWLRSWRALPEGKQSYGAIEFDSLQIDMQVGKDVPASSPAVQTAGYETITWPADNEPWIQRSTPSDVPYPFDVCYSPELDLFVAVGNGSTSNTSAMISSDGGVTWTAVTFPSNCVKFFNGVCWAAELGLFIAYGNYTDTSHYVIATSPDGVNWTGRVLGSAGHSYTAAAWSGSLLLVVGTTSVPLTSTDGINYTAQSQAMFVQGPQSCIWAAALGKFIVCSQQSRRAILFTTNGSDWTAVDGGVTTTDWHGIAYAPSLNRIVVVGHPASGTVVSMYSDDGGSTWVTSTLPNSYCNSIAWSPDIEKFALSSGAGGVNNFLMYTSSDGIAWDSVSIVTPGALSRGHGLCWSSTHSIFAVSMPITTAYATKMLTRHWLPNTVPLSAGSFYGMTVTISGTVFNVVIQATAGMTYADLATVLTEIFNGYATATYDINTGLTITSTSFGVDSTVSIVDGPTTVQLSQYGGTILPLISSLGGTLQASVNGTYTGGSDYVVNLRWSNDGGHLWSNPMIASIGALGETSHRVMFRRLGSTSIEKGLDRVWELSSSDPFPVALIAANMEASKA